jgi:hypothetical protein
MRGVVKVVATLLLALVVGGLVLSAVAKARMAALTSQCQNNLWAIGFFGGGWPAASGGG